MSSAIEATAGTAIIPHIQSVFKIHLTLALKILALTLCTSSDDVPAFKFDAPSNAGAV